MPLRLLRAPAILVPSLLFGPMAQPCVAGNEPFSIRIQTEGQKLLVIGNNRLAYDLQCDLEMHLGIDEANPVERTSGQLIFSTFGKMTFSREHTTRSTDLILKDGLLAKGSAAYVLHSQQISFNISAAKLTRYGCRLKEEPPEEAKKDQSRPPFDKR
jgi:hypothetical protein